jgi:tetraacyldisaccharide 4'-kinase
MKLLNEFWYKKQALNYCLLPFSYLYQAIILLRQFAYQKKLLNSTKFSVPVIVVGNITVGGTGKTPLVIYLANWLKQQGFKPGVVSRGYGGKAKHYPLKVSAQSNPAEAGDEPVIIARQTACPVYVAPNRVAAVKQLLQENDCNIIISDDGLQHYALARDIEIVVIDGARRLGNQFCLPAGPLREPAKRIKEVDFIICNGQASANEYSMHLIPENFRQIINNNNIQSANYFKNKTVHAIAGIGNPQRFFAQLRSMGLTIIEHEFPDHYAFQANDFVSTKDELILMTEKDAVKCQRFATDRYWYLPVKAQLMTEFTNALLQKLMK